MADMTKSEAENVLKQNNYCLLHLVPKQEGSRDPQANACSGAFYYCQMCVAEDKKWINAQIDEAIAVLTKKR